METELKELGIVLHATAGYAPKQNGVAERGNQIIGVKARAMMTESGVPLYFWYQACSTAVFLTNRRITTAVLGNRTPFEVWHFRKPNISHLRVFGCKAYRLIRKELRLSKFQESSSEGVLVGYDDDNFNLQVYDLSTRRIHLSHDVTFDEDNFPFIKIKFHDSKTGPSHLTLFDDVDSDGNVTDDGSVTGEGSAIPNSALGGEEQADVAGVTPQQVLSDPHKGPSEEPVTSIRNSETT